MDNFTKEQLFNIRNNIDIDWLINEKLCLKMKYKRVWRFCCPLCKGYNTATKKQTNLGRCFDCKKNYNTIDLVIYTKKLNFIPSVQWLIPFLENKKLPSQFRNKNKIYEEDKKILLMKKEKARQEIKKIKQLLKK